MSKFYTYYVRLTDRDSKPLAGMPPLGCVVFTPLGDGRVARGISICSCDDNWDYKKGRNIALGRAKSAMATGKSAAPLARGNPHRASSAEFLHTWVNEHKATVTQEYKVCLSGPTALEEDIIRRATGGKNG